VVYYTEGTSYYSFVLTSVGVVVATSGTSGTSATSGSSGSSGTSGNTGASGTDGTSGTSGNTGLSGTAGTSGTDGATGTSGTSGSPQNLQQTLAVGNESGTYSIGLDFYYQHQPVINTSVSGTFTQSVDASNSYFYTLTGNTSFRYTGATYSIYNFFIKAGTYSFSLDSASNWQTVGATALGFTGSFVMSCGYDGTDMWVSAIKNYQSY
jgi:hypothetical protein